MSYNYVNRKCREVSRTKSKESSHRESRELGLRTQMLPVPDHRPFLRAHLRALYYLWLVAALIVNASGSCQNYWSSLFEFSPGRQKVQMKVVIKVID